VGSEGVREKRPIQKSHSIELTRPDEAEFYYTLRIDDDMFGRMKNEQNLLVAFDAFPQMFNDLLDTVVHEERSAESK
jgi:hypothetical protein